MPYVPSGQASDYQRALRRHKSGLPTMPGDEDYLSNLGLSAAGSPAGGTGDFSRDFNLNPAPRAGQGAYGAVPGALGLPDPAGDLGKQIPGLPGLNKSASDALSAKLSGTLSPGTLNALKNAQATFGVGSGMPGSGLSWNSLWGNIAGASEAQQMQGLQAYAPFVGSVSGTQTVNPALQHEIANQNAINAAAPDPTAAASEAERLYGKYLANMRGPGGGTGGGGGGSRPSSGGGGGYGSFGNFAPPATPAAAPTMAPSQGWGETWSDQGGYASVGSVPNPQVSPGAGFNYDLWNDNLPQFDYEAWENP